ncbi:MAG TPA: VIT and VWA domain-containing protein, partial [Isosphaeraceae bacterium]
MFHPGLFENARHDGIGVLELAGEDRPGAPRAFVPLRRTELVGEVAGPLAALRLTQVFGLDGAPDDRVLEALYRFPLPGDAAVTGVTVRFGEVGIRATLKERDRAEADYAEAKRQGRPAALATRETPDVFTLQVAGIRADQEITVATSYVQLARPEGPGWSLRLPLTTAPRYVRGDEAGTRPAAGQPLSLLRDPGHRFRLDLLARAAEAVTSASHALDVARAGDDRRVRLRDGEVVPDRDCVLAWRPAQPGDRPALRVLRHEDDASGRTYFLALVAPPAARDPGRVVPREAVLLVDRSGSMEGAKWQAADWAVERFLSGLSGRDAFALGLFHDTTRWLDRAPRPAEAEAVARAVAFLKAHRDRGGTELGVALEQALHLGRAEGRPARHVLIVTDAQVSDSGRILRLADEEARRPDRRRISLPCIDAAPNSHLALELAARGGGV